MSIKDLYIKMCEDEKVFLKYSQTGEQSYGRMFYFLNTNYRLLFSGFQSGFKKMQTVEGQPRKDWEHHKQHYEEIEKQHTVNMRKSELFSETSGIYNKTSKGKVFESLLNTELGSNEKQLLTYLLVLDGYFNNEPSYIINRCEKILQFYNTSNIDIDMLFTEILKLIKASPTKKIDFLNFDYLLMDTFFHPYNDFNFLEEYIKSSATDKQELKEYVKDNIKMKSNQCIISKKYENGGGYTTSTLKNNAFILYITLKLIVANVNSFEEYINAILAAYSDLYEINVKAVRTFIFDTNQNHSIFRIVYCKSFNAPIPLVKCAKDLTIDEIDTLGKIDSTDQDGMLKLNAIELSLKKLAKIKTQYHCEMEELESCTYFTSKDNHKPYLEIHHFIPREFSNDFNESIEVLDNYVALCPKCHKKIHLAEDLERKHLLTVLFNKRMNLLKQRGIDINLNAIKEYYKFDKGNY